MVESLGMMFKKKFAYRAGSVRNRVALAYGVQGWKQLENLEPFLHSQQPPVGYSPGSFPEEPLIIIIEAFLGY